MKEELDHSLILPDIVDYDISLGKIFNTIINIIGFLMMLLGLSMIYAGINGGIIGLYMGPVLILGGAYIALTRTGVQIDNKKQKIRQYVATFGLFKQGTYEDFSEYPFIAVLMSRQTSSVYTHSSYSYGMTDTKWEVFLLNKTHRKRIQIDSAESKEKAEEKAKIWTQKLNKEFTIFNPQPLSPRRKKG